MKCHKLVRDNIPAIIRRNGEIPIIRVASKEEVVGLLEQKLQEEITEFLKDKNPEELADIIEVVYALGSSQGISPQDLEKLRKQKQKERGGFNRGIVLIDAAENLDSLYSTEILGSLNHQLYDKLTDNEIRLGFRNAFGYITNRDVLELYYAVNWGTNSLLTSRSNWITMYNAINLPEKKKVQFTTWFNTASLRKALSAVKNYAEKSGLVKT